MMMMMMMMIFFFFSAEFLVKIKAANLWLFC